MRLAFLLLLLAATPASAQGTGTLAGTVFEADSVMAVIGANVRIGGTTLGAVTDFDGNYRINGVPVGIYTVTASYGGYQSVSSGGVEVISGSTQIIYFVLLSSPDLYCALCYAPPLPARGPYTARVFPGNRFSDGLEYDDTCGCPDTGDYWGEQ